MYNKVIIEAMMLSSTLAVCPTTANSLGMVDFMVSEKSLLLKNRSIWSWLFCIHSLINAVRLLVCVV